MEQTEKKSTGNCSTGYGSTGDGSTGNSSTGNSSTGDYSTGYRSTGDYSTGYRSTGDGSTGDYSTGYGSTGYGSTGYRSTGDRSTGDRSTGDFSTGSWSTSNWSTGYFSTIDYMGLSLFNKPITKEELMKVKLPNFLYFELTEWIDEDEMTNEEKKLHPYYSTIGGFLKFYEYKEAFKKAYKNASLEEKKELLKIPNFDADIFLKISGIDVRLDKELYPDKNVSEVAESKVVESEIIVLNGKKYMLVK